MHFPRKPRLLLSTVYFRLANAKLLTLSARLFWIPFDSMSHWSTHRLILLLHKYYNGHGDIKGSRAQWTMPISDPKRSFLCSSICGSLGNWAEPVLEPSSIPSRSNRIPTAAPLSCSISSSFVATLADAPCVTASTRRRSESVKKVGEFLGISRPLGPQLRAAGTNRPLAQRSVDR